MDLFNPNKSDATLQYTTETSFPIRSTREIFICKISFYKFLPTLHS